MNPESSYKVLPYLSYLLLFVLLYGVVFSGLFFFQMGTPTPSSMPIHVSAQKKLDLLAAIDDRKILLVGGSSTFYGVRAKIIEQETGIKTVNMALSAGRGIPYILDKAREIAEPGDIIIMPLEYQLYLYDGTPTFVAADYIISRDPEYFYHLPLREQLRYASALTPTEVVLRAVAKIKIGSAGAQEPQSTSINEFGDETRNTGPLPIPSQRARLVNKVVYNFRKATLDTKGTELIKSFAMWCKANQVTLLAAFPTFAYYPDFRTPLQSKFFNGLVPFYHEQGVPVLGNPYDFMYGTENFFDTEYHVVAEAAEKNTYRLIELLKSRYPNLAGAAASGT